MTARKLIFLVTEDRYFLSHRLPMALAAQKEGFYVAVITNAVTCRSEIEAQGVRVIPLSLERRSLNPFKALAHIRRIKNIYQREKPDLVHHIAMKPVLYGSLAAWFAGVPAVVNAFAGLGYVFTAQSGLATALRPLLLLAFRFLLKRPGSWLLLQNEDDRDLLRRHGLTPEGRTEVIRGSGIDPAQYRELPFLPMDRDFICVFSGRMIGIKGLQTLKDAFALLEKPNPRIKLWLCGAPDPGNPGSWSEEQLRNWGENVVYKGQCPDMAAIWAQAHAAVQPSWGGEGVPKSLLEAAASGRAIIAADVPGCRDVVEDGKNGYLAPPRDARALADALARLAADPERYAVMGHASRVLLEKNDFTAEAVTARTAELYRACVRAKG
jgi:glycosyltransferase involved in cell wall biosynthesis